MKSIPNFLFLLLFTLSLCNSLVYSQTTQCDTSHINQLIDTYFAYVDGKLPYTDPAKETNWEQILTTDRDCFYAVLQKRPERTKSRIPLKLLRETERTDNIELIRKDVEFLTDLGLVYFIYENRFLQTKHFTDKAKANIYRLIIEKPVYPGFDGQKAYIIGKAQVTQAIPWLLEEVKKVEDADYYFRTVTYPNADYWDKVEYDLDASIRRNIWNIVAMWEKLALAKMGNEAANKEWTDSLRNCQKPPVKMEEYGNIWVNKSELNYEYVLEVGTPESLQIIEDIIFNDTIMSVIHDRGLWFSDYLNQYVSSPKPPKIQKTAIGAMYFLANHLKGFPNIRQDRSQTDEEKLAFMRNWLKNHPNYEILY
ncbi:MAG: hypothetical protein R2798_06725 [Chitinophagales bacterium]|nr:hypothetical protein [Bacteroidota bacterium]MCB9043675.1 hypothetical protein [Chitinophagales bacterium]